MTACDQFKYKVGKTSKAQNSDVAHLCSNTVLHAHLHPALAVLLDDDHTGYLSDWEDGGRLFAATGEVAVSDGSKVGCRSLKIDHEVKIPVLNEKKVNRFRTLLQKAVAREYEHDLEYLTQHYHNSFGDAKLIRLTNKVFGTPGKLAPRKKAVTNAK